MIIRKAAFLQSNTKIDKLPSANKPEYAFIGRSNVGKSSLINMLTNKKQLAKTSSTPGKTITINHFIINDEWYLVDLPGYGFAQRSKKDRESWKVMLDDYIKNRKNLICMFVLVDSRIEPQKIDLEFINHLGELQMPFNIIFTKVDKIKEAELQRNLQAYKDRLAEEWEEIPQIIVTSSEKEIGKDDVLNLIEGYNQELKNVSF
ncbi:MAG: YihA family ribosome biogenesis GTP-binding protein [Bacteroidales bacterium]|nr:YihA family ribosome biogenesis GTP-binding protein [Bacteroidales bacterium]